MEIGFIGLGNMGFPMARRLVEAHHDPARMGAFARGPSSMHVAGTDIAVVEGVMGLFGGRIVKPAVAPAHTISEEEEAPV